MTRKSSSWSKGWKESISWKPGEVDETTSGDSQSSQEQWAKESQKESRWKDVAKVFHEAGLHINEKESFVTEESQRK